MNIATFDDGSAATSSSICHNIEDNDVNVDNFGGSTSKSVTSESVGVVPPIDDDPDFVSTTRHRPDQVGGPALAGIRDKKTRYSRKAASGTEATATVDKRNDHSVPSASSSTTASRLANYLLHHVNSAPVLTGKNTHRSDQSRCDEILPIEKEAHRACEDDVDLQRTAGDFDVQSLEWFELDSKEDLEDFDKF